MKLWIQTHKTDLLITISVFVLAVMSSYVLKEGYEANQRQKRIEEDKIKWHEKFEVSNEEPSSN